MILEVDEFSMDIHYDKHNDELKLSTDRELKNSDILLILIHMIGIIEKSSRNDVLDLALAVVQEREATKSENLN